MWGMDGCEGKGNRELADDEIVNCENVRDVREGKCQRQKERKVCTM